jgi:FHA domain-containing protein
MDILSKARKLESTLARTFDRAAQQWSKSGPRGPLEVLHAILEAVDARVEPAGRGRRVFPFNRIRVSVAAPTKDARARLSSVLDGEPSLQTRIAAHLRKSGCDAAGLSVRIAYAPQAEDGWIAPEYHIDFTNGAPADVPPPDPVRAQEIALTVTLGTTAQPVYALTQDRINLGRGVEVRDHRNHLIRTNHVVFTDDGDATNNTVSRRHAHIDYEARARDFRITDDRSAHGTSIVRNGVAIPVHPGSRGVRLQSGDEIVLGEARLKVTTSA